MAPAHSSADADRPSGTVLFRVVDELLDRHPALGRNVGEHLLLHRRVDDPGQIALTRTPFGANAYANDRVSERTAALDDAYTAASVVVASFADDDERFTTAPPFGIVRPMRETRSQVASTLMA